MIACCFSAGHSYGTWLFFIHWHSSHYQKFQQC